MKSAALSTALLAYVAVAQPHGHHPRHHHEKRELVVEWETVWETITATVMIDETATSTIFPPSTTPVPGEFFEPASTSVQEAPTVEVPPPAPSTTTEQTTPAPAPTTSSVVEQVVQPQPTTTAVEKPEPSTAQPAPEPAPSEESSQTYGLTRTSEFTYYTVGLGACGYVDDGKDNTMNIVAVPYKWFDSISEVGNQGIGMPVNPLCDRKIVASANGKSVELVIRDRCGGCENWAIDVSEKAFLELFGSTEEGRTEVTWSLVGPVPASLN